MTLLRHSAWGRRFGLIERGFDPVGGTAAEFARTIKSDRDKYAKLVLERGIRMD